MTSSLRPPSEGPGYQPGSAATASVLTQRHHRRNRFLFLARVMAFVLAGYLLFDRAFAWIHVPGTPIFIGEVALATGLFVVVRSKEASRFIRLSPPMQVLIVFMALGAFLTVIGALSPENNPQEAVRDAAIWYYGLFAVVMGTLARAWEPAFDFFLEWYTKIIPVFLVVGVVRLVFANQQTGIFIPDSEVPISSHKPGNLGVQAVILIAFLLLVVAPELEKRERTRNLIYTVAGLLLLALAGTQNRGVMVAGFIALIIVYVAGRAARPFMGSVLAVVIAALILAFSFNLRFDLQRRTVSVDQLFANILSIDFTADSNGTNEDDGTIAWRLKLWELVMDDTFTQERFLSGFGFGPNLAGQYGFVAGAVDGPELRNPHNSHLSVVARMGLAGTALWIALWVFWYRHLWRARKRFKGVGEDQKAGFLDWCMVAILAALINGVFDPSLEGPQAAVWVWSIFGLGAFVAVEGNVSGWRTGNNRIGSGRPA
ncbi:MAG: O-antigen ligase family protein [Acidimicrobiia bacterium]|nr:O-antigen ligase family protein [Acidimicrobiia bacterium]